MLRPAGDTSDDDDPRPRRRPLGSSVSSQTRNYAVLCRAADQSRKRGPMNVRDLCNLLSATLHLPGVDRWAEQLGIRELLPGLDHEVYAIDAALLLVAVVAAPRPADAPRVVVTLADLPLAFVERKVGSAKFPTWVPGIRSAPPAHACMPAPDV